MVAHFEVGPDIAAVARLLGDPTRALMVRLVAADGPISATSLARLTEVSRPTASAHLTRLVEGGVLKVERVGRHAYYHLNSDEVAIVLDALSALVPPLEPVAEAPAERLIPVGAGLTCYDHLGGQLGFALTDAMRKQGLISRGTQGWEVDTEGWDRRRPLGITCGPLVRRSRRRLVRGCTDWSERRQHIGGSLAAAVAQRLFGLGLVRRCDRTRHVRATELGAIGLRLIFGVMADPLK